MKHGLILLALLFILTVVSAQEEGVGEITISPALMEQIDQMEADVAELRELEALFSIERRFPTPEEATAILLEDAREELPDDVLFEETQFYRAFGFIEDGVDLWKVYSTLVTDQVLGFYDPDTQEMNIILLSGDAPGDSLPAIERITYSHEYVHALQDQHFDLELLETIEEPDQLLAALALVEGDASFAMQQYVMLVIQEEPGLIMDLTSALLELDADVPEGTPQILEAELTMPYLDGMFFVMALYNEGDWEMVDTAYTDLPQSTEQILHPELYLAGDAPQTVEIADVGDVLGSDWHLLFERTLGEFYLREYLSTQLSGGSSRAAVGWGGDRYILYYNQSTDQHAWVLRLAWDTREDATEFFDAFQVFAEIRLETQITEPVLDEMLCWQDDVAFCLLDRGDLVVAYAPTWEQAAGMIAGQP